MLPQSFCPCWFPWNVHHTEIGQNGYTKYARTQYAFSSQFKCGVHSCLTQLSIISLSKCLSALLSSWVYKCSLSKRSLKHPMQMSILTMYPASYIMRFPASFQKAGTVITQSKSDATSSLPSSLTAVSSSFSAVSSRHLRSWRMCAMTSTRKNFLPFKAEIFWFLSIFWKIKVCKAASQAEVLAITKLKDHDVLLADIIAMTSYYISTWADWCTSCHSQSWKQMCLCISVLIYSRSNLCNIFLECSFIRCNSWNDPFLILYYLWRHSFWTRITDVVLMPAPPFPLLCYTSQ